MTDELAARIAAAGSDEDFAKALDEAAAAEAAGTSVNPDELDIQPLEDKSLAVTPTQETKPDPVADPDPKDPDPAADPNAEPVAETHDVNATLNEDDPKQDPKDPKSDIAKEAPRFVRDAQNLAEKWDTLSDSAKLEKVTNLAKNRPHTFKALAKELGTSPELLLTEHELDSTDYSAPEDLPEVDDPNKIYEKAKADARAELEAEQKANGETGQAERNRFVTEVSNFAKHNKLDAETAKAISDLNGDLFKSFEKVQFDPSTGESLSIKGRLKIALGGNEAVQSALIKAGALNTSKRVLAGVHAALPKSGSPSKSAPTTADEVANSDDQSFGQKMDQIKNNGVVPIEF